MNKIFVSKHPILTAILMPFIPLVILASGAIIISIFKLNDLQTNLTQASASVTSFLVALLIIKKSSLSFTDIGFRAIQKNVSKQLFYWIPLIIMELLPLLSGFDNKLNIVGISGTLLYAIGVGLDEEIYFRGILVNILKKLGNKKALIISSLIFAVVHVVNIIGGDPVLVIVQIVYAFCFGFVAAEILIISKSILPCMLWHGVHDFIEAIITDRVDALAIVIYGLQLCILITLAIIFWRKLKRIESDIPQSEPLINTKEIVA